MDQRKAEVLDERIYDLAGQLSRIGISAERFDRISDFTRNFAIVPVSAKTGYGIPDLLMVLSGLAQTYLESQLRNENETPEGTVLEVREERGMGEDRSMSRGKGRQCHSVYRNFGWIVDLH